MFYAGDEVYDDEITSGPYDPELDRPLTDAEIDAERQAIEDEYDQEQSR